MRKLALIIVSLCFLTTSMVSHAATLNISQAPLFITDSVSPLTMLVMDRSHKLYFEAYNDASDVNDDGKIDLRFNPAIDYFGYFDSYKCYTYNSSGQYFAPISVANNKKCSGAWSGNYLNYLTTARMDAIRKVFYGGYRVSDSSQNVILERTYIPQDGHSWGKQYTNSTIDGFNISDYTPFASPASGNHLFANTTLLGTARPLLRVALNQPYAIEQWVSIERPVAGSRAINGSSGPFIAGIKDYVVRVKVCDENIGLEANCKPYPNGSYKPIGLLQEYGENDAMYFGLLTGSYNNNLSGGVIRKNISSFTDELDLNSGRFTSVNGIVSTLNKLTIYGFGNNYYYNCGWITTRNIKNGECKMWGNPIAEMVYEATRYFAGKGTPTSSYNYSGGVDVALGLAKPSWEDPYQNYPRCAKANVLVISDLSPNYDSDQVPGTYFGTFGGDLSGLNVSNIAQQIFSGEGLASILAFIGQSAGVADGAPTPKTVTSFGNIRGLAPHEANSQGSYYGASVANFAHTTDISSAKGTQTINTFAIGLAAREPEFKFNVNGRTITIIPFAKSVKGSNINATQGRYQPTNNIVDYYIESISPTAAVFDVNFEDVQQGADFDMDAIARYEITTVGGNLNVKMTSSYAAGGIVQHMGYVISGTSKDGVYLEIRDRDTSALNDRDYFLDTPPGQDPGGNWNDGTALPLITTRQFTPSSSTSASFINSPLWYLAKWGGFIDLNNSKTPDNKVEYDADNSGTPDNLFIVNNATLLGTLLMNAFSAIIDQSSSFSAVAASSSVLGTDTSIYQALFDTRDWSGQLLAFALDPNTGEVLFTGNGPLGSIWGAAQELNILNFNTSRRVITYKPSNDTGIPFRWPANPAALTDTELDISQVSALNANPVTGLNDGQGNNRLNYIRGDSANEEKNGGTFRDRKTPLGDIINSAPVVVGPPAQQYPDSWPSGSPENSVPYSGFRQNYLNRATMIYVGANDGTLHAFNNSVGRELLAYVPSPVYQNLSKLTNPNYTHHFYVDGTVTVIDAFIGSQWRTILAGGLNAGGQGIYALDVTSPGQFSESIAKNLVKWEFTDADDADLGYTYSQPAIVRLANGKWAAIFGNGYNNTEVDGNVSTTGNSIIYIVDIATGQLIKKFDTQLGQADDPLSLGRPNGMSSPVIVDTDGNSIADLIYAGDLFGRVWKIDISSTNPSQWDFSFKQGNKPLPFYIAEDANGLAQPITIRPTVSRLKANVYGRQIYIGTGKYIEPSDKTDKNIQSVYALRDDDTTPIASRAELQEQTILQESDTARVTSTNLLANNDRGWYMDLVVNGVQRGERIVSNMVFSNDRIIFTSIIPSEDPCEFGGESWLMELNAFTGTRMIFHTFDLNGDGGFGAGDGVNYNGDNVVASGIKSALGLTAMPTIISAGEKEFKYLSGTSGGIQRINENPGNQQYGRQSWRQFK